MMGSLFNSFYLSVFPMLIYFCRGLVKHTQKFLHNADIQQEKHHIKQGQYQDVPANTPTAPSNDTRLGRLTKTHRCHRARQAWGTPRTQNP